MECFGIEPILKTGFRHFETPIVRGARGLQMLTNPGGFSPYNITIMQQPLKREGTLKTANCRNYREGVNYKCESG